MSKINLTPPEFTVTVGGLSITSLVQQFSLRQGAIDIRRPIIWEGTMAIAKTKTWTGESLDDFENPSRWARGKHPVVLTIAGSRFATLRIASYAYNEDTDSAQIELSQLLGLLDYKTPPEDYRFIETACRPVFVADVVAKLLTEAGVTSYNVANAGSVQIPAPDRTNRSYIELAQEILGERNRWLYHDEDEVVRINAVNFNATKSFGRSRAQLVEFNRQPQRGKLVPNLYRVTGGGERFQSNCSLASTIDSTEEIYGDKITRFQVRESSTGRIRSGTTTISRIVIERIVTQVIRDEPGIIQIKKTGYKTFSLTTETGSVRSYEDYKSYEIIQTRYYDDQGRLTKEESEKDGIAYGSYPDTKYDFYPDALVWGFLESSVTEYSHDPASKEDFKRVGGFGQTFNTDVLRLKIQTNRKKLLLSYTITANNGTFTDGSTKKVIEQFYNVPIDQTVETWIEKCPSEAESGFIYRKKYYSRDPAYNYAKQFPNLPPVTGLFLINNLSAEEDDATPPSWTTRPPLCPRENAKLKVEIRRNEPNYSAPAIGSIGNRETEYNATSITTDAEAQQLANTLASLAMGRAFGYECVMSLREATQFISDPTPLQIAWLHKRAFLLDAPSVVFDGKEAEVAWEAVTIKKLSVPVGSGTPVAEDLSPVERIFSLDTNIALGFNATPFNAVDPPDLTLITVTDGDVVTSGGFVQASANQNQFAQLLVANDGTVVVDTENGNVVTTANDVWGDIWDTIATMDGDILTIDGEILWFA